VLEDKRNELAGIIKEEYSKGLDKTFKTNQGDEV